jgi:glutamate formiminotransferase/formiminotetrahydrofolate cyclodeaminase
MCWPGSSMKTAPPKTTDDEKAARTQAIDAAMIEATETPLDTMRACQQALRGAVTVAARASRNAASDVAVGIELLVAAIRSGGLNVDTNVGSLRDQAFAARAREERQQLEADSLADAERARKFAAET